MSLSKIVCTGLALMLFALSSLSSIVSAQSVFDIEPPVIELELIEDGIAGQTQVFTAVVADDQSLKDVKLYYRFTGQQAFSTIAMTAIANTDYYHARLATTDNETRAIEYYIQARDNGGNRVVRGFAFDPLIRTLSPPANNLTNNNTVDQTTGPAAGSGNDAPSTGGVKWWHIALGVLAIGALASAAGGSDDPSDPSPTVPITLTVTSPTQ